MLQNMGLWGRAAWVPDLLALVLVFWSVHQPLRVGIGIGLCIRPDAMDVHQGGLLGQHALAYTAC
jgi:rod shape-determining protein MreD